MRRSDRRTTTPVYPKAGDGPSRRLLQKLERNEQREYQRLRDAYRGQPAFNDHEEF